MRVEVFMLHWAEISLTVFQCCYHCWHWQWLRRYHCAFYSIQYETFTYGRKNNTLTRWCLGNGGEQAASPCAAPLWVTLNISTAEHVLAYPCMSPQQCPFPWEIWAPVKTHIFGPHKSISQNGISIGSAAFAGFAVTTNRHRDHKSRLDALYRKAKRHGFRHSHFFISQLIDRADRKLFLLIQPSHHRLSPLLPSSRLPYSRYFLRSRGHQFSLSQLNTFL